MSVIYHISRVYRTLSIGKPRKEIKTRKEDQLHDLKPRTGVDELSFAWGHVGKGGVFRCLAIDKSIDADTTDSAVSL